jgi:hypothetical protein
MGADTPITSRTERLVSRTLANRRGGVLASLGPSAAFLVVDSQFGFVAAMIAATVASLGAITVRRLRGQTVGLLLPLSLAYVVVRGLAGALTESEQVFFGFGILMSAAVAIGVGATAFTRTPVAGFLLPLVTPYRHLSPNHPFHRRIASQITLAWALIELGVTVAEWWHLSNVSGSEFVIARAAIAWPFMAVVIFLLIAYARFRLDPYEYRLAAAEAAA